MDVGGQHGVAAADPQIRPYAGLQKHRPLGAAGSDLGRGKHEAAVTETRVHFFILPLEVFCIFF